MDDNGHIIDNTTAEMTEPPYSDAENESTYFTDFSNMSGQVPSFGDSPFTTGGVDAHLLDNPYAGIPNSGHQIHATSSMDFDIPDQTLHLEGTSSFTRNVGEFSFEAGSAENLNFEEYDETRYPTDFSNSVHTPHSGDRSFFGGADEEFSHVAGAEIFDNASYNAKAPLSPSMMPQSAVGPQSGYNHQDAPQPGDNYNIGPPNPNKSNELPSQSGKKPRNTKKWEPDEEEALLRLYDKWKSYDKVGKELHRSYWSCKGRRTELLKKKKEIEARIQAENEAIAAARVPVLRMKYSGISRVDWAAPVLKDKSSLDWETPGLKEWVHGRLEIIRNHQNGGPWMNAWNVVAEELNKENNTNVEGKDLVEIIYARPRPQKEHTGMGSTFSQCG